MAFCDRWLSCKLPLFRVRYLGWCVPPFAPLLPTPVPRCLASHTQPPLGSCRSGAHFSLVLTVLPFPLLQFPMAFHSSQSWQVCLLHHAVTTGGKKPRGPCCGRLHPCVSGLAVPRPSYCCLLDQQPGLGTPGSPVLHRSYWQHCLKSSVSTLYSCHQTARVTRSYLTPAVGHLSLTTCGMTEDTCVRYPAPWKGAVVAMPSCDPEGTWEHSRAGNTWHRNRLMLSQARLLLTQTFLLLLSRARCRRLQDFPGSLRSICEVVCPQLSEASRVTQHGGPLLGPTGTYISSPSPLLFPPLDGRMFTIWNSISSLLCLSLGF